MKNLVIVSFPAKEGMLDDLKKTLKVSLRASNIPSFAGKDTITKFFILTPIYKQI